MEEKDLEGPLLPPEAETAQRQICPRAVPGKHLTCNGAACPWMTTDAEERSEDMKKLSRAVIFCVIFMLVEVVGGIKAGSLAILTDAAHLLSDVASFAISLFAMWAGGWEANPRQTYGFFRLEILGALVSIQIIWLITGIIIYEAFARLFGDSVPIDGRLMFIIAALGLLVNLVMMFILDHGHGHGHGHGHSHGSGGGSHGHSHGAGHQHSHGHTHSQEKSRGHSHSHSELAHSHDHHHGDEHVEGDDEHGSADHHDGKHVHKQDDEAKHKHKHDHDHDGHHHGGGDCPRMDHSSSSDRMYQDAASIQRQKGHNSECVRTNITRSPSPRSTGGDTIVMCICDEIEKRSEAERSVRVTIDHGGGGGDHEGHDEGSTGGNINVRGAYLHVLGDFIQSIGVMVGGAIIWYKPSWKIVDLICTFFFSILVLWTTIKMIRDILEVLMESTPREIDAGALERGLMEIDGVLAVHELHIWAITVGKVVLACHVLIKPDADSDDLLHEVIQYCDQKYKISHVTVQIERYKE